MKDFLNKAKAAIENVVEEVTNNPVVKKAGEMADSAVDEARERTLRALDQGIKYVSSPGDYERLRAAAEALYRAGRWDSKQVDPGSAAKLWEELRDAAGIPDGTETKRHESA